VRFTFAERQWGLITSEQAYEAGISRVAVHRHIKAGRWRRILPRVYATEKSAAFEQQALAAHLWAGSDSVVSHRAAARLHGLAGMEHAEPEITLPPGRSLRSGRVRVHLAEVPRSEVVRVRGMPTTDVERTLVDLGGVLKHIDLAIAVEDAWHRRLIEPEGVLGRLDGQAARGRPGEPSLRKVLKDCEGRRRPMESPLEVRVWWLIKKARLERPLTQYRFNDDDGQPLRLDFAYERQRLAIEADGYETHRERFEQDRERASRLAAAGWRLIQVTHRALQRPQRVASWIRQGLAVDRPTQPWEEWA
jgi:very-short-patch-repair endonuclease